MKRVRHGVAGVFAVLIGLCISTPVVAMDLGAAREAVAQTVVTTARGAVDRVIPSATSLMRAQQQQQQQQQSSTRA